MYKYLTKCISNPVRFGKKMIKKECLQNIKNSLATLIYLLSIRISKCASPVINEK